MVDIHGEGRHMCGNGEERRIIIFHFFGFESCRRKGEREKLEEDGNQERRVRTQTRFWFVSWRVLD